MDNVELPLLAPRVEVSGNYTLTLTAADECRLGVGEGHVPEEARMKKYQMHSFDKIAWTPVDEAEATTLDYLMKDYVDHLKNHLNQILGADWEK